MQIFEKVEVILKLHSCKVHLFSIKLFFQVHFPLVTAANLLFRCYMAQRRVESGRERWKMEQEEVCIPLRPQIRHKFHWPSVNSDHIWDALGPNCTGDREQTGYSRNEMGQGIRRIPK